MVRDKVRDAVASAAQAVGAMAGGISNIQQGISNIQREMGGTGSTPSASCKPLPETYPEHPAPDGESQWEGKRECKNQGTGVGIREAEPRGKGCFFVARSRSPIPPEKHPTKERPSKNCFIFIDYFLVINA